MSPESWRQGLPVEQDSGKQTGVPARRLVPVPLAMSGQLSGTSKPGRTPLTRGDCGDGGQRVVSMAGREGGRQGCSMGCVSVLKDKN